MIANTTPPSSEVSEAALADARRLATGLYPHQVEGVAFLLARRRSILADDMGLGKTRQAIVAMRQSAPRRTLAGGVPCLGQIQLGT